MAYTCTADEQAHDDCDWSDAVLATVIDLFSSRVIGRLIEAHMRIGFVADALQMAVATRGGNVYGLVFHTDRGSQGGNVHEHMRAE